MRDFSVIIQRFSAIDKFKREKGKDVLVVSYLCGYHYRLPTDLGIGVKIGSAGWCVGGSPKAHWVRISYTVLSFGITIYPTGPLYSYWGLLIFDLPGSSMPPISQTK
ncbi:hypothetical protein VNO77_03117 [Canavalia gladiata]|uniref:Uncharacterized protein n=1 Tax=Canavalia gladiata TaxID=3824 RepID=A0AAN9R6M5_CANGL